MKKKKDKIDDKNVELNEELSENEVENEEEIEQDERDKTIAQLEKEIASLTKEVEKIKKAAADIVNRNKQMEIDKKYAASDLVRKILVPMSYFEGALKFKSDDEAFVNFLKGFEMIYNLLLDTLKSDGLKEIVTNINDPFNPRFHEVTDIVEVEDEEDRIVDVIQKGFMYKERVISPVKVKVSKLKKENDENQENNDEIHENNNENQEDLIN